MYGTYDFFSSWPAAVNNQQISRPSPHRQRLPPPPVLLLPVHPVHGVERRVCRRRRREVDPHGARPRVHVRVPPLRGGVALHVVAVAGGEGGRGGGGVEAGGGGEEGASVQPEEAVHARARV